DVLYAYASKLAYEQLAHSFIVDTSTPLLRTYFKTVSGIDENLATFAKLQQENSIRNAGIEVAKICQEPHDRKHLGDSLKLSKLLNDIFYQQSNVINHNEAIVKEMEIVGLLHSRLQLQQLIIDYGSGSCLHLRKENTRSISLYFGDMMEIN
ncbi:12628_t:CDS:2, partial [Racocetra fulgida]